MVSTANRTVYAELFVYEPYDYTIGDFVNGNQNGGIGFAGPWTDSKGLTGVQNNARIDAGSLDYTDGDGDNLQTSGGHAFVVDGSKTDYRIFDVASFDSNFIVDVSDDNSGDWRLGKDDTILWVSFR